MKSIIVCSGIIMVCLVAQVNCASRRVVSPKKVNAVACYACKSDSSFQFEDQCLFPTDPSGLTYCSADAKYCQADIVRIMGVFSYLERQCTDKCGSTCISKGYGATTETCTYCCEDKPDCGLEEDLENRKN